VIKVAKVWFVGVGSGDPELITLKAHRLIQTADAILFASSAVSIATTQWAKPECDIVDSQQMTSEQITDWLINKAQAQATILYLQSGDPVLYGALIGMFPALDAAGIEVGVVPGVTVATAAAAIVCESLTSPKVTQTVIFTQIKPQTPMPEGESLQELAQHQCTLCLYTEIICLDEIQEALFGAGWEDDAAVLIAYKIGWNTEEKIVRATLTDVKEKCQKAAMNGEVMMIVSPALGLREWFE
jgi:precorrin-4/cobalt-precorrin-4 C11-methyltransferase